MAPARVIQIGIPYLVLLLTASTQPELLIAEYITAPSETKETGKAYSQYTSKPIAPANNPAAVRYSASI